MTWGWFVHVFQFNCFDIKTNVFCLYNFSLAFLVSLFSFPFFNEKLSLYWWFGATLITFGLVMMHQGIQSIDKIKDKKSK